MKLFMHVMRFNEARPGPYEGYKKWRGHGNLMSGVGLDFKEKGTLLLQIT